MKYQVFYNVRAAIQVLWYERSPRLEVSMQIRMLLADNSAIFRSALTGMVSGNREPEINIVGEALTLSEAAEMAKSLRPDVVLIDCHMPSGGLITQEEVKNALEQSGARIVGVSFSIDEESRTLADCFGAHVLLDKMELSDLLIHTLEQQMVSKTTPPTRQKGRPATL